MSSRSARTRFGHASARVLAPSRSSRRLEDIAAAAGQVWAGGSRSQKDWCWPAQQEGAKSARVVQTARARLARQDSKALGTGATVIWPIFLTPLEVPNVGRRSRCYKRSARS